MKLFRTFFSECEEGPGVCALVMTAVSLFMILLTLPVSLIFVVKVVQVRALQIFYFLTKYSFLIMHKLQIRPCR